MPNEPTGERLLARRYRLVTQVGRGGMGTVWQAHDEVLGRDVAVKEVILPHGLTDEERSVHHKRTFREARTAARLGHPGVVTVYDVVEEDDRPWIVMELIKARSLDQVIKEEGPLEPRRAADIGRQMLAALHAAHDAGVLHRDVKPSNVLVTSTGRMGDRAVLTDFGIATASGDATLTQTGLVMGSPAYIAPERARGRVAGPASDLWSLGVTLYAMVHGKSPFERAEPMAALVAVISDEPDPPERGGPLGPVIEGLLRKNPDLRMDAIEAGALLDDIVRQETVDTQRTMAVEFPLDEQPGATRVNPVPDLPAPDGPGTGAEPPAGTGPARPKRGGGRGKAGRGRTGSRTGAGSLGTGSAAGAAGTGGSGAAPAGGAPSAGTGGSGPGIDVSGLDPNARPDQLTRFDVPTGTAAQPPAQSPAQPPVRPPARPTGSSAGTPPVPPPVPPAGPPVTPPPGAGAPDVTVVEGGASMAAMAGLDPAAPPGATVPDTPADAGPQAGDGAGQGAGHGASWGGDHGTRTMDAGLAPPTASNERPGGPGAALPQVLRANRNAVIIAAVIVVIVLVITAIALASTGGDDKPSGKPSNGPRTASSGQAAPPSARSSAPEATPKKSGEPAKPALPAGFTMHHDHSGYAVPVPKGWSGPESKTGGDFYYAPGHETYIQIDQTDDPGPSALDDWRRQERGGAGFPGYHKIKIAPTGDRPPVPDTGDGSKSADWEFTFQGDGGRTHVLNRGFVANGHGYAILLRAPEDDWAKTAADLEPVFRFFEPADK